VRILHSRLAARDDRVAKLKTLGLLERVKTREAQIALQRMECARQLGEQQKLMLEARRRCRLFERLEERQLAE
jgi:hypothetical protein